MKQSVIAVFTAITLSAATQVSATNHEDLFGVPKEWAAEADPHAGHHMGTPTVDKATAGGKILSIDAAHQVVNMSHDPIPDLGWPAMTMDILTTKHVQLSQFKPGDKVSFDIKKGRDNVFRITKMHKVN